MRNRFAASMMVALATTMVIGMRLMAQDRFTLESPNGIAFSQLRGYDSWTVLAVSHPDNAGGCGTSKAWCIKAIVGNPVMVNAYNEDFPANGKPVPVQQARKSGHFAPWEQPQLFSEEMRAGFRSLRK